eukprot:COSAG02_NODE_49126_length_329_cov_0.495652_1_plen_79_part_01
MTAAVQVAVQGMLAARGAQDSRRTAAAAVYRRIRKNAGVVAAVGPAAVAVRLAAVLVGGLAWDIVLGPYVAVVCRTACT